MKIKKFNESVNNWTEVKIQKTYDDWYEVGHLVLDYLELYHNEVFEVERKYYVLDQFWFENENGTEYLDSDNWFSVYYEHSNKGKSNRINYTFSANEFDELLNFMNTPEVYKQGKKYNL